MARIHRVFCCLIPLGYFCAHTFVGIANSWTQPARMGAGEGKVAREAAVKFTYFPLFAKGPACAFALEHSGIEWQGAFPDDWKSLKATTPFLHLPILETEDAGTIGHELAILNYIGQKSQKMGGAGAKEFAISQQLMCQAEDIYQKLVKLKAGIITGADADAFWNDVDEQSHNRNFGVKVYLQLLEAFYKSCGVEGGKFTTSGVTVGECKLFATFHILILIKEDILKDYPGLSSFYTRFASEAATQSILKDGGKMPDAFGQCCRNVHIGCEQPRPEEPTSEPFDCRAGLWNFREGWSKTKKDYCCRHHELGCESRPDVVIFPFTNKPVAKCAGVESEISSCVREPCLDLCEPVHCEFSDWSLWSNLGGCFGLCQRERKIIQPNNECGRPCHGPKVVTKAGGSSCMPDSECELEGDVNCHWDDWSEWSNTCFDVVVDQTHRWRKILVEPALNGRACDGPFNETRACAHAGRKDCKFSLWSKWTECTASCEGGTQSRLRQVDTFAEHGGAPCQGMLREAQACNPQVCPGNVACEVSEWSPWHGCTEAMFQKFRSRSLVNVPPVTGDQELFCEYSLMEAKGCPRGSDEPGLCKLTTWSEWGACSSECDGSKVRNRSIVEYMKKTCHVTDVETMMEVTYCGSRNCHNRKCVMTDWTEWSECSHRCGPGVMDRTREVTQGGNCEAPLKELRDCQVAVCQPEDCTWGDWTFWSSCTKSCGSGVHRRHREVKTAPRHGGKACDPKAREEVGFCNNQTCDTCIDGQWGPWSPWGRCSGTCSPAFRVRHRDPIKFPNHCGVPALGLEDEYELCDYLQECDDNQDCLLSSWSLWSDCSCECFGIKERSKRIVRNAKGDGKPCNATMKEVFPCNPGTEEEVPEKCLSSLKAGDCELSAWTEWTDCSASCDGGQRERERSVETPNLKGGQPCNNTLKEVEACSTLRCPNYHKCQSCEWGAWSEWGLCSKCGGQRYRTRIIAKMSCPHWTHWLE
eukprot:s3067_g2.t1